MGKRAVFATKIGAIAATVGSAVGLGNIWRFPYEAGINGGGAFIIVYIGCVIFLGIPVILSEFIIGRATHKNAKAALIQLAPHKKFYWMSYISIGASFVILGFYSVVCGWVIEYLYQAICGNLSSHTPQEYSAIFNDFISSPYRCVLWTFIFLVMNFLVMRRGIRNGVEKASNIMMPLLFVILIIFCINSLSMPGAKKGLEFLFRPDFSSLTAKSVVDAMGQAFFSLTLGISGLITYSSYFKDDEPLVRDATLVATLDTAVAILAGVVIFPAVFSFGMHPESGPKLIFETLPNVFQQMPGGYIWSILFFILVFFASITSTISLNEISITFFGEEYNMSRDKATWLSTAIVVVIAMLSALSFNVLSGFKIFGMNIFDFLNFLSSNVFMLLGGLFTAFFVGWYIDRKIINDQLTNYGNIKVRTIRPVIFCMRYVAPVSILLVFLFSMGWLDFIF
jgi:NSS family neurotransmitter:Na+ symporter